MKKSEAALELLNVINIYSDYMVYGVNRPHSVPDLEYLDFVPEETAPVEQGAPVRIQPTPVKTEVAVNSESALDGKNRTLVMIEASRDIVKCKACPLHQFSKNRIPGRGLVNTRLFVIAPPVTVNEERDNFPLAGNERDFFYKWMQSIAVDPDKIFITNILKCNWGNTAIKIQFIESCRTHLDRQLAIVQPEIILTLGQMTLSSLKKTGVNIMEEHGKMADYRGYKVFPIFDPAMVLANQQLKALVWEDLKQLKRLIGGE